MVRFLKENGLDDNTIVIYSSDQGFYLGDHGWVRQTLDVRRVSENAVDCEVAGRGQNQAQSIGILFKTWTMQRPFWEVAGARIPADMQGKSLTPLLKGESQSDLAQVNLLSLL